MLGESQHAIVLGAIAQLAPVQVVAILLSTARVAPGRLQMAIGVPADPDIGVGRWNRELTDARQNPVIANPRAARVEVLELGPAALAPKSRLAVADVYQSWGLAQRGHRDSRSIGFRVVAGGRLRLGVHSQDCAGRSAVLAAALCHRR